MNAMEQALNQIGEQLKDLNEKIDAEMRLRAQTHAFVFGVDGQGGLIREHEALKKKSPNMTRSFTRRASLWGWLAPLFHF